ncbi:hypothetical protein C8J57DRAFT_1327125 [Mycena rebaudengoi]|nr:hypothetical protein C8J57DRAFT_1327125 [Mycena rebaudengoi]
MSIQFPRKLLVLDLNGTLLLRTKRTKPQRGPPLQAQGAMRARVVHPRPYLGSFREYIFHPKTASWLDTMVWSSAQPFSVADMVNHCFGEQQRQFLAIWARDTLGLSPEEYHRKARTTKDLAKPWGAFPEHSAHTTVLLDDSALKAHLQPWNHICLREYVQQTRNHDLEAMRASKISLQSAVPEARKKKVKSKKLPPLDIDTSVDLTFGEPVTPSWYLHSSKYDQTLLAVIGILEAMKKQMNVAEWIQGGGLLPAHQSNAGQEQSVPEASPMEKELWFNSEATVNHWVDQGVHALESLQIDVVSGVHSEPPPSRPPKSG